MTAKRSKTTVKCRSKKSVPKPVLTANDALTPRDELFIELYFHYDFDPVRAFLRSGFSTNLNTARSNAYKILNQPAIQAAILARREHARNKRTLTREEKVSILEGMVRDERAETRDRLLAMRMHSQLVGDMPAGDPERAIDRLTAAALRALPMAELIEQINRGATCRVLPSPVIDIQATHTNGNGHTNGTNGKTNGNGHHS